MPRTFGTNIPKKKGRSSPSISSQESSPPFVFSLSQSSSESPPFPLSQAPAAPSPPRPAASPPAPSPNRPPRPARSSPPPPPPPPPAPLDPDAEHYPPNAITPLSNACILRLCKTAGAEQVSADVYNDVRRAMYLLLNELLEKSYHIMTLKKLKTIMPSHLDQAAEAMGLTKAYLVSADDIDIPKSNIVKAAKQTLAKHRRGLRVSREAVERLTEIVGVALIRWIRSAVGLVAHCGRKRLNSRDLKNIAPIAQNVPHISLHNPGYDHYYTGDVGRGG